MLWADVWVDANSHKPWRANGGNGTVATSSQGALNTQRESIFGNDTRGDGPFDVGPDTGRPRDNTNFLNLRILIGGTDHFQIGGRNDQSRRWRITRGVEWITVGPRTPEQMNRQLDDDAARAPAGTSWDYGTGTARNITVGTAMPRPPVISHPELVADAKQSAGSAETRHRRCHGSAGRRPRSPMSGSDAVATTSATSSCDGASRP